jgi:hypothetical protein
MSGYGDTRSTWDTPISSCSLLVIETQLSSPQPNVIGTLTLGEVLDVDLQQTGVVAVVVALKNGVVAGGIAATSLNQLRDCIEGGTVYQATVTGINGGQIRIRITAV